MCYLDDCKYAGKRKGTTMKDGRTFLFGFTRRFLGTLDPVLVGLHLDRGRKAIKLSHDAAECRAGGARTAQRGRFGISSK